MNSNSQNHVQIHNDLARSQINLPENEKTVPCNVVFTRGVLDAFNHDVGTVVSMVMSFDDFTEDNDPYQEHDFGSFTCHEIKVFFKFDYLDTNMEYGIRPTNDPSETLRVLTVLLADEY